MYRFYASMVFLYYNWLGQMWWAVIGLGVTQTLILIPLRIIRVIYQNNIKDFQDQTLEKTDEKEQEIYIKKHVKKGNKTILFYSIDFLVQLFSYLTIGRLFLTDFYTKALDPTSIYNFIPYPNYPIQGTMFKLPFPWFSSTKNYGLKTLLIVWMGLVTVQLAIFALRFVIKNVFSEAQKDTIRALPKGLVRYATGYLVIMLVAAWFLVRHFPTGWKIHWFIGSVTQPNRTFNTVTAVMTFITLLWFGVNRIIRQSELAENNNIEPEVIRKTQNTMLKEAVTTATLVGLGAYFITNQIPCAFELSIFTLEIISLAAPLTLDRIILNSIKK